MTNINPIHLSTADAATTSTLNAVKAKLGVIPNMFLTLANTPVALNAYMQLSGVAASGKLSAKQREQIALTVGEQNNCDYCLAAHSVLGGLAGLKPADVDAARSASASDARDTAMLQLAAAITRQQGKLTAAEVAGFKAKGLSDADILEVLVNVVLNIYTNYTNHIAATEIDFPRVAPLAKAA
ncbi:MAG: carboxymuconolactone decarboxylase family protein [Betaproteobacteria bacterium]|nr:carboxymuconolactone decarboxylase family protein [Betaproteobacteria bacterium]